MRGLSFSEALHWLKDGGRAAREGWNGKGMWVALNNAIGYKYAYQAGIDSMTAHDMNPFFVIKQADGTVSTWVPSVGDCLAEDWMVV